jgi:hypothetical protein
MAISSQGTTFTFSGVTYTVTSISVQYGSGGGDTQRQRVSAAHLDSDPEKPEPFVEVWQPDPGGAGRISTDGSTATASIQHSVQIEFTGTSPPVYQATGSLVISGPMSLTFASATCNSSSVRLTVGDFIRGSASFTVK